MIASVGGASGSLIGLIGPSVVVLEASVALRSKLSMRRSRSVELTMSRRRRRARRRAVGRGQACHVGRSVSWCVCVQQKETLLFSVVEYPQLLRLYSALHSTAALPPSIRFEAPKPHPCVIRRRYHPADERRASSVRETIGNSLPISDEELRPRSSRSRTRSSRRGLAVHSGRADVLDAHAPATGRALSQAPPRAPLSQAVCLVGHPRSRHAHLLRAAALVRERTRMPRQPRVGPFDG